MTNTEQIQETLKRFKYLAGSIDQDLPQKFIVERKGNDLIYHARFTPDYQNPQHYEIADMLGAKIVIGGGRAGYQLEDEVQRGVFSLWGGSSTFGNIPKCVMEQFREVLFNKYRSLISNLNEFCVMTENEKELIWMACFLKPEEKIK